MGLPLTPGFAVHTLGATVLVVGNLLSWQRTGRKIPVMPGFVFASFHDVTLKLMIDHAPELILSAVLGVDFDVVELAKVLERLGFSGRYRALTINLPNPQIILNEVRLTAPLIDFDLFDLERDFFKKP